MAITFPASPVNGQTHTENGQIFVFDSTRGYWLLKKQDQIVASTSRSTFVATAGQTVHNVSYDPSASVIVSVNGVMLNPQDVTATNGTSITFDIALTLSDEVDIVFHQPTASNLIRQDISDPMATESYVQTYVTNNSSAGATTTYDNMTALVAETGMSDGDMAFVLATNNLYIYKTNGWFKIATVENLQPGSISGVDASYELATDGTPTVITATATDPEGFPLTWSYAVTTGTLGNTATVSQTDNVFTITPSTDLANSGEFSITFSTTDGMNGAVNVTSVFSLSQALLLTLIPTGGGTTIEWDGTTNLALSSSEEYTVTAGRNASISVKMWGGGGARGMDYNAAFPNSADQGPGGGGGNTNGTIAFTSGSTYIFQVGEGGARSGTPISGATWKAGGLPVISGSYGGTEGGGYSGIFSSSVSQANALLIAGGGGGGSDESYSLHGGAGGGASGQDGYENNQGGRGGTQSAGGNPSPYNNATGGSALTGGVAGYGSNHSTLGGGGGGYYGGGGGNVGGGGGGSGYFKPSSPVSNGSTAVGSSSTPANSSDTLRSGAGDGGSSTQGSTGADGIIVLMAE